MKGHQTAFTASVNSASYFAAEPHPAHHNKRYLGLASTSCPHVLTTSAIQALDLSLHLPNLFKPTRKSQIDLVPRSARCIRCGYPAVWRDRAPPILPREQARLHCKSAPEKQSRPAVTSTHESALHPGEPTLAPGPTCLGCPATSPTTSICHLHISPPGRRTVSDSSATAPSHQLRPILPAG